jgi:hypothetical protein
MMKKNVTSGLAVVALTAVAVLATAAPANAVVNPAPDEGPAAFTAYVDEAYAGTVAATLTGGTWDWVSAGSNYRFSTSADCAAGFGATAPAGLIFTGYNLWPDDGAWPNSFGVTGTPTAADALGGPASDGVYPICVDIRDDEGGHAYLSMTITILVRPVEPPVDEPEPELPPVEEPAVDDTTSDTAGTEAPALASTGVDGTLALGLGLGAVLLASFGGVALRAARRRTARN